MMALATVMHLAAFVTGGWSLACLASRIYRQELRQEPPTWVPWIVAELKPLYWPIVAVRIGTYWAVLEGDFWWIADLACWACIWWVYKDEGDDRWKRRRKKAADAVKALGGKLVVVPAPAPSGG